MVFTTGLLRNANHMYASRDDNSWIGFTIFAVSMVVVIVGWVAATPFTLRHPRVVQRVGFALIGPAQRLFEHVDSKPGEYTEKDISPYFWHNGQYPESEEYQALLAGNFVDYRLRVNGLVEHPVELDLADLRALPLQEQITQHFCIQGWSGIARWGGVSMQTIIDLVQPKPGAKWVVFYSLGDGPDGGIYYDAHPIEQMGYHLTMLAYDMNGAPCRSAMVHRCDSAMRRNSVSSRSSGSRAWSSSRTIPTSVAASAGTTRIMNFSGTGNPCKPVLQTTAVM